MAEPPDYALLQSDPSAVSSLAEVLGQQNGALTPVPPEALYLWLPELQTPADWVDTTAVATAPVTRMMVRRARGSGPWDACELLNLYRVPGRIAIETVLDNADRGLRYGGATDIQTYRRDDVPTRIDGLIAVRVSGRLVNGCREVQAVYNYYAINTSVGAALIEQATVVGADAPAALAVEVECLAESVYQSLIVSLCNATPATQPRGLEAPGNSFAVATQTRALTTSAAAENSQPLPGMGLAEERLQPATTIPATEGAHGGLTSDHPARVS